MHIRKGNYSETRRVGWLTAMAFCAGTLLYLRNEVHLNGIPLCIIVGLIYAVFLAPIIVATSMLLPRLRAMIEHMALSRLVVAILVFLFPGVGTVVLHNPPIMGGVIVLGGLTINRALGGAAIFAEVQDVISSPRAAGTIRLRPRLS